MNIQEERGHSVRIALKEKRMCISMDVLRAIGSPKYIQMLINRGKRLFFIRGCDTMEQPCFAVSSRVYTDTEYKYRLSKVAFAEAIGLAQGWDSQGKYRLYGSLVADRIMRFSFEEAVRLDCDEEGCEYLQFGGRSV